MLRKPVLAGGLLCLLVSSVGAAAWTQTPKRIDESGEINLGYRVDRTPISLDRGANRPAGYSIESCNRIAAAVEQEPGCGDLGGNCRSVTAENRLQSVDPGEIDMLCGATAKTLSRAEIVGFTQPALVTGGALLSRNENVVDNLAGLAGRRVAAASGATTIESLEQVIGELDVDAEFVPVDSTKGGMNMFERGGVDAFAADQIVLIVQVISRGGRKLFPVSGELFSFETFALAVPRGDADFQLVADRVLSDLKRSGGIAPSYRKWFGSFG